MYLDEVSCLETAGFVGDPQWVEPFKHRVVESKMNVGMTTSDRCRQVAWIKICQAQQYNIQLAVTT